MTSIDDLINASTTPAPKEVTEEQVASSVGGTIISEEVKKDEPRENSDSSNSSDSGSVPSDPAPVDEVLNMLMARVNLVEDTIDPLRMVIFGPPGVGKTVLACCAPNPLLVNIEKGSRSLKNHPELNGRVRILDFVSIYQLEVLISKIAEGVFPGLQDDSGTLVIDSGTELQKRDLDDVLKLVSAQESARNRFIPTGPDYNANTEHMRQLFTSMRDLPCNIIVTAQVKEVKDERTGTLYKKPNFTDKLGGTINHLFDTIAYLDLDNEMRTLQVHPGGGIIAKTRIGGLPTVVQNPKMSEIVSLNKATPNP